MFKIKVSNFSPEKFSQLLMTEQFLHRKGIEGFWDNLRNFHYQADPVISIFNDQDDISSWFVYRQDLADFDMLHMINQNLCLLLTEENPPTERMAFPLEIVEGNLVHFADKPYGESYEDSKRMGWVADPAVYFNLIQIMEEAIRAVKEVKDVFWHTLQICYPKDPLFAMSFVFEKEEHYTKALYEDPNFDWLRAHNESKCDGSFYKYTRLKKISLIQEITPEVQQERNKGDLLILMTTYTWEPLEHAWTEYKKKHGITDADVAAAIKNTEEKS